MVIGIDPGGLFGGDTADIVNQFVEQTGVTFPVGWDRSGSYSAFRTGGGGAISPFPLDVLVDADGKIRFITREYDPSELAAIVETML